MNGFIKMNNKQIEQIIKKETEKLENGGCEITNIEIKEWGIKFHINNYNNDCYGGYKEVYKFRFPKEEEKEKKKEKPQSGELCPHCGNRIEKKHKFCPQCGQKIEKKEKQQNGIKFCPHCGQKIGKNNIFCPHCGQKITSGGE